MSQNHLPLSTGWQWTIQSWQILSKAPLTVFGIVGAYIALLFIANLPGELLQVPYAGVILGALVTPFAALAFTTCGRDVSSGQAPNIISCFAEGWKDRLTRQKLLILGLIYGLCMIGIGFLTDLLSLSTINAMKGLQGQAQLEAFLNNIPWLAIILGSILYLMLLGITCFSPMLIAWRQQAIGKAFFFSLVVCLRNFGPILVLGLVLALIASGGAVIFGALGSIGSILVVFWGICVTALSYSALWPMWVSIFGSQNTHV